MNPDKFTELLNEAEAQIVTFALAVEAAKQKVKEETSQLAFQKKRLEKAMIRCTTLRKVRWDHTSEDW